MADLPADVQRFFYENIETLEELEVLALMHSEPAAAWSVERVEAKLGLPGVAVAAAFRRLRRRGLIEARVLDSDEHVLPRSNPTLRRDLGRLMEVYRTNRYELMMKISEAAMDRVRQSMTRAFADAFVIGKRRSNG